jgi:hypothetical protein
MMPRSEPTACSDYDQMTLREPSISELPSGNASELAGNSIDTLARLRLERCDPLLSPPPRFSILDLSRANATHHARASSHVACSALLGNGPGYACGILSSSNSWEERRIWLESQRTCVQNC